jgi:hypothetical protein
LGSSTAKKVIVRRFDREPITGYVNTYSYLQANAVELLRPDGTILALPYAEVKSVSFVKDFEDDSDSRRIFLARPKLEGLWVRMVFTDGEVMDGIMANNLLGWDTAGFTMTPPESDANSQRIFVPRQALRSMQVLGVVGSPLRAKRKKGEPDETQPSLF